MSSTTKEPPTTPASRPVRKRRFRIFRFLFVLILVCAAALAVPPIFQFLVKHALITEAWRQGDSLAIERVEGSLWEPVRVLNSRWSSISRNGSTTRLEVDRVEATFAWRELFNRPVGRWFEQLTISGVRGKVDIVTNGEPKEPIPTRSDRVSLPFPSHMEAKAVDLVVVTGKDYVKFQGVHMTLSELEAGTLTVEQIVVKQPWFNRTFRDVHGMSGIQGQKVLVADLELEPGVTVKSISAEASDLAVGLLNAEIQVSAFGGLIRGQARSLRNERQQGFETSGNFSQIGVAPLATFLGVSDAAGGTIKEGKFTFRGSLHNLSRAAASLRLEATNFQWDSRQWDSLVIGASMLDKRIQIPELELHQGHNHLSLYGELALPTAKTQWWQSEFSFNIAAKVENLTELSALMLPEFKYAAGKVSIDGAIRGKAEQFNGALIVSGSNITWRNAPIEELHAALKITGNELHVANFELLNKNDYVRGRGVVNILGEKQYWGEFRASVEELGTYAALLQRPIVPEPLAGGGTINWSGEGSAKGQTGTFSARLQNLRTLGATGAFIHPLRANLEGTYSPGTVQFSQFALSDEASAFTANVSVGNKALNLQSIRLMHGTDTWLEGDAILPLDLWQSWPNTDIKTLLTDGVAAKINLTARQLQLREASRLTGWKWPIAGVVDGKVEANGPIGSMVTSGEVTIQGATIPLAGSDAALEDVTGQFGLEGQMLKVSKFAGKHRSGSYAAEGTIDFTNVRDTTLKLTVTSEASTVRTFEGIAIPVVSFSEAGTAIRGLITEIPLTSKLTLNIVGPASAATVSGTVSPKSAALGGVPELARMWTDSSAAPLPLAYQTTGRPWAAWKLDIAVNSDSVALHAIPAANAAIDLKLTGSNATPDLIGTISVTRGAQEGETAESDRAAFTFRNGQSVNPTVEIVLNERFADTSVSAHISGPWTTPLRTYDAALPLTPEIAKSFFEGKLTQGRDPDEAAMRMSAPAVLGGDAPVFEWAPIPDSQVPESPDAAPAPASAAPSPRVPAATPLPPPAAAENNAPAPAPPIPKQ